MRERETSRTFTIDEVAEIVGLGRNATYRAAKKGDIPTIRIGGRILVPKAALWRLVGDPGQPPPSEWGEV